MVEQELLTSLSAPVHVAVKVQQFLAVNNMIVIPHPSYLPVLTTCDICIFLRMKLQLQDHHFMDIP